MFFYYLYCFRVLFLNTPAGEFRITIGDVNTLKGKKWVNDKIMNFYFALLMMVLEGHWT